MGQFYDSTTSSFYRDRYPRAPVLDKGNLGPPMYGPYQQRWDPNQRAWFRPDGSRAALSGLGSFGDMTLPELDLAASGEPEVVDKQTFVTLAIALALGLGGGWALQKHYKLAGYSMLGIGGFTAIAALLMLKRNVDARNSFLAWQQTPAPPPRGMPGSGKLAGSRVWGVSPNLFRGSKSW